MKRIQSTIYCLACAFAVLAAGAVRAAEFKLPASDATPAELVNAALRSELDGPSEQRKTLLEQALSLDPNYAPARWQSGYVRWDDQWLTLDEVAKVAGDDKRLAAYRQRRDALIDRADDHRELARWCKKNQLADEARVHWAKVLEFNPSDAEALQALDLQFYEGRLLTGQQITEAKKQAGERLQAMRRWQPQMVKWRKAIERGSGSAYEAALESLRELDDVESIDALEATFAENGSSKKADALNRVLIETVGHMPTPEATQVLLRRAIQPDSAAVRAAACDELKKRPMYAYVPQLIVLVPGRSAEWRLSYQVSLLAGGAALLSVEFKAQSEMAEQTISQEFLFGESQITLRPLAPELATSKPLTGSNINGAVGAARKVESITRQMAANQREHERQARMLQERVNETLVRVTGTVDLKTRAEWNSWWNDWEERYQSYDPLQRFVKTSLRGFQAFQEAHVLVNGSCFPIGTPVLSIEGARPIEDLRPGDRVMCIDPKTGELAPKPVQHTTLRPAAPLVKITLGSHTLSATRGHPFWVNGQGWTMAKHLKVGQILHGIDGAQRIDAIEEGPPREAYNLVVGDYGTYFVGELPVLVHDNSPLTETTAVVPGLDIAAAARP